VDDRSNLEKCHDPGAAESAATSHAANTWIPLVYEELRRLAAWHLADERKNHTLSTTALVNEAYLRLSGAEHLCWSNRGAFFAAAASAIRRVLIDHARGRDRIKRGGEQHRRVLVEVDSLATPNPPIDVCELNDALESLARISPRRARVAELTIFGGLTADELAEATGEPRSRIGAAWRGARAYLLRALDLPDSSGPAARLAHA
jgi:RNA polymerase sigma factor (TIGR02999 family)